MHAWLLLYAMSYFIGAAVDKNWCDSQRNSSAKGQQFSLLILQLVVGIVLVVSY